MTTKRKKRRQNISSNNEIERGKRSAKEQLEMLDTRLGKGVGATKERARLNRTLNTSPKIQAVHTTRVTK